jgi:hypothetical protein
VEHEGSNGGEETHKDSQQQDELLVADVAFAPLYYSSYKGYQTITL